MPETIAEGAVSTLCVTRVGPCGAARCPCQGRGALAVLVADARKPEALRLDLEEFAPSRSCIAASLSRSTPSRKTGVSIYYRDALLLALSDEEIEPGPRMVVPYDLPGLDAGALRVETAGVPVAAFVLFQPPRESVSGRAIDALIPKRLDAGVPGNVCSLRPLLLAQQGGWIAGDFLAKFALRQRQIHSAPEAP